MLKRIHIRGYKSLEDVEVRLPRLAVLIGANSSGKSNLLDALQLLSKLATSRTLKDAFDPPYRGRPIESFTIGKAGIKGLLEREKLSFSIEADLKLSDAVVGVVNRQIREMPHTSGNTRLKGRNKNPAHVRRRDLRYRIEVEMSPRSGVLRVADEYLATLNSNEEPSGTPFMECHNRHVRLRPEQGLHAVQLDRYLDRSVLSMPFCPTRHPHLAAARLELENWQFFHLQPGERMRAANPLTETRHIGSTGEGIGAFLNSVKETNVANFRGIEKTMHALMPNVDGIETEVSDLGDVHFGLKEGGTAVPVNLLSDGALRILGFLAANGAENAPALVGMEELERGIYTSRIPLIAELLKTQETLGRTQYVVTTHSSVLPDFLDDRSLFVATRTERRTRIEPITAWGPLRRGGSDPSKHESLPVSERIMRGDFDG